MGVCSCGSCTPEAGSATEKPITLSPAHRKMDRSLAKSLMWRAAADWTSQILSWASLLVVVRLLTPADFGIAAMAVVFFPYPLYLADFPLPQTTIPLPVLLDSP